MCTNGSRVASSTPAKARRTGKPSPSNPVGAVVTERTGRCTASKVGEASRGRATVSAVTAGIGTSRVDRCACNFLVGANTARHEFVPAVKSVQDRAGPGTYRCPMSSQLLEEQRRAVDGEVLVPGDG